ncbi:hypothetical protein BGW39_003482 [Mortierella sp. 14UC]|nr:hypothetical protein BGW39_003482 [Mortierella sp. 14UC]
MDDLNMDEDFDFANLTLGEFPRGGTSHSSEVLHLSDSLSAATLSDQSSAAQQAQAQATSITSVTSSTSVTAITTSTSGEGPTPDNGPWAKLPSAFEEINPYLPGVTAQKLDAMAMDPHHVFKSAPPQSSSSSLSFSIPPEDSQTQQQQQQQGKSQKDNDKDAKQGSDDSGGGKDKIPAWMLADPELKPTTDLGWSTATTSTTQNGDSQGWGDTGIFGAPGYTGEDLSTTMDSNALFGFSSYPTYESLSIANAIAEEQHRKHTILASGGTYDPLSSSSSSSGEGHSRMREGGFARFGNTVRGDGQIAPVFGRIPSLLASGSSGSESGATTATTLNLSDEQGFTWDTKDQRQSLTGSQHQHQQHRQWQTWRSSASQQSGQGQQLDLDQDMDEDDDPFDELSPKIK